METKNRKERSIITTTLYKAVGILAAAIITSFVAGVGTRMAIANTIPFRVQALEDDVLDLKKNFESTSGDISTIKKDIAVTQNDIQTMKESLKNINSILSNWEVDK
jgi:hypothetical protein